MIDVHYASLTSQGVQHRVFHLDGHPSRYQPRPTGLNFGEQTITGVFPLVIAVPLVHGLSFAAIVLTRPHGWFVEGFKCSRFTAVHFACLWNCNGFTVVKSNYGRGERKQRFIVDWMEGIFEPSRTCSSSMDMELISAISPLNTPTTVAAPEIWLHNSAKVHGSLHMEEKSTVDGAEELQSGARKKISTDKGK